MVKTVYLYSPKGAITGGPEAIHQCCDALNQLGFKAYVCYYTSDQLTDIEKDAETQKYYSQFYPNLKMTDKFEDKKSSIFVFPEVTPQFIPQVQQGKTVLWHLANISVRNDYSPADFRDTYHACQSHYAKSFVDQFAGIQSGMLTDYTSEIYLEENNIKVERENLVLYNPKKGFKVTQKFIQMSRRKDIQFIALENFSKAELRVLMMRAKLYIDFGTHPGKDRFPRECALMGSLVLTNTEGAAGFVEDVPLPSAFKVDISSTLPPLFSRERRKSIKQIKLALNRIYELMDQFSEIQNEFDSYRNFIRQEKRVFFKQAKSIFSHL